MQAAVEWMLQASKGGSVTGGHLAFFLLCPKCPLLPAVHTLPNGTLVRVRMERCNTDPANPANLIKHCDMCVPPEQWLQAKLDFLAFIIYPHAYKDQEPCSREPFSMIIYYAESLENVC